jgi:FdhD protein
MAGRTGCGLCGTESLEQVERPLPPLAPAHADSALTRAALRRAMEELPALQALQQATGAVHAAGWCGRDGAVRLMREDVGRHNALDKLVGAMAAAGIDESERARGFIAVTSRASFEMVHKVAAARVPVLAAVSAATTLAADLAQRLGLALAGFVRQDNLVIYTGGERLAGLHHGR